MGEEGEEEPIEEVLRREEDEDHCLFAVDVRNVYGQPFEVTFERRSGGDGECFSLAFLFEEDGDRADDDSRFVSLRRGSVFVDATYSSWLDGTVSSSFL